MNKREQLVEWLEDIAPWSTKLDMTFEWNCDEFRARRIFQNWMEEKLPGSTYVFSVERDPLQHKVANTRQGLNQACHVHAISDTKWKFIRELRSDLWKNWFDRFGRCRIDLVKSVEDATGYCIKKVMNYSEGRVATKSHVRKTDVDWDLVFGKGKHAARLKDEASKSGQTYWSEI
tara:strand:- start:711 stop:1235 length:525 start_codon:yes stop_codon:yes gene_type:complete